MVEQVEYDTRKISNVIKKKILTPCVGVILQNPKHKRHYSYSSYCLLYEIRRHITVFKTVSIRLLHSVLFCKVFLLEFYVHFIHLILSSSHPSLSSVIYFVYSLEHSFNSTRMVTFTEILTDCLKLCSKIVKWFAETCSRITGDFYRMHKFEFYFSE